MPATFKDASLKEVDSALQSSFDAFKIYRQKNLQDRATFLCTIASMLEAEADNLVSTAAGETNLELPRLKSEFKRTLFQLTSYAAACAEGSWLDIRIDTALKKGEAVTPSRSPDLRKMLIPLGPVVVFGASNFPFAYSTAGGDTACALAAGCPVLIKAHPAHAHTSDLVAAIVQEAARKCGLPEGVFIHLHGAGFEVGKALVEHHLTSAVGFTGSLEGGRALFDLAAKRPRPIPVFAEMGSVNPVFLLPRKLEKEADSIASMLAASITLSVGQFCTNPGLIIAMEGPGLDRFKSKLSEAIRLVPPAKMLHPGIAASFIQKREKVLSAAGVELTAISETAPGDNEGLPTFAEVPGKAFLANPLLQREVFGPFSLLVTCSNIEELKTVCLSLEGQLTSTVFGLEEEVVYNIDLVETIKDRCGRLIFNGVPTGVEVALAMHHGGPYPATTDSRFTAVGADGIRRFSRPLCFQNWADALLPEELKNANPLNLWRTINNELTKAPI